MLFDFEDRHVETPTIESAMSWREQVLLSIFAHVAVVLLVLLVPRLDFVQAMEEQRAARLAELAQEQEELLALARLADRDRDRTFVFIEPLVETEPPAAPRPDAPLSDRDRIGQSPEVADDPLNTLPNAEGNSSNFIVAEDPQDGLGPDRAGSSEASEEAPLEAELADSELDGVTDDPVENAEVADATRGAEETAEEEGDDRSALLEELLADGALSVPGGREDPDEPDPAARRPADGLLGRAMRNLERYSPRRESFANSRGRASQYGPDIQFDSRGADFGPWIRRFIAQVRRNWFVPYAVMSRSMHGHVVLTFYVNRDGSMTDLRIIRPAGIDAFNNSAFNALATSNPTQPLPAEYPDDRCFFTVTFYFNESPPI